MLGRDSGWVRNVRANGMRATLRHGRRERVALVELAPEPRRCALLLQRYLQLAPGARPHLPVRVSDPVEAFEGLVERYPIFRVVPIGPRARALRDQGLGGRGPTTLPSASTSGQARHSNGGGVEEMT